MNAIYFVLNISILVTSILLLKTFSSDKKLLLMALGTTIFYFPSDTREDASLMLSLLPLLNSSDSPVLVISPISFKCHFEKTRNSNSSPCKLFLSSTVFEYWEMMLWYHFLELATMLRNSTKGIDHGGPSVVIDSLMIGSKTYSA